MNFVIAPATSENLCAIKRIADLCRHELGFVRRSVLEQAVQQGRLLVARESGVIAGFVHFRTTRQGYCTVYEIGVDPNCRRKGIGRALIEAVIEKARNTGMTRLRLKCPIDLPANGFYAHLGFNRVAIEPGRKRALAVWEKVSPLPPSPGIFFLTLTNHAQAIQSLLHGWRASRDPRNPFANLIVTPLFVRPSALQIIRELKTSGANVVFDSGGYQVQMGRIRYEELFSRLLQFYNENSWADWYVLPDNVPSSTDSMQEVNFKVQETLDFARLFLDRMPADFRERAIGVVHGQVEGQIRHCVEAYSEMGIRYIGFGSFGTSGPNGSVNLISKDSLRLLRLLQTLARDNGLHFHIFGIGSPSSLVRLGREGITPTSFDSAGWWKAGAYGNIFFPDGPQIHITALSPAQAIQKIQEGKVRSGHHCPFCDTEELLLRSRQHRILHNLAVMMDRTTLV